MVHSPCCVKSGLNRGPWSPDEDKRLVDSIHTHGPRRWNELSRSAGLNRCGKSCRQRWKNYLSPNIRRGNFSEEEELKIINLHKDLGPSWAKIAAELPQRTANEIRNYWNTHLSKKARQMGIYPTTNKPITYLSHQRDAFGATPNLFSCPRGLLTTSLAPSHGINTEPNNSHAVGNSWAESEGGMSIFSSPLRPLTTLLAASSLINTGSNNSQVVGNSWAASEGGFSLEALGFSSPPGPLTTLPAAFSGSEGGTNLFSSLLGPLTTSLAASSLINTVSNNSQVVGNSWAASEGGFSSEALGFSSQPGPLTTLPAAFSGSEGGTSLFSSPLGLTTSLAGSSLINTGSNNSQVVGNSWVASNGGFSSEPTHSFFNSPPASPEFRAHADSFLCSSPCGKPMDSPFSELLVVSPETNIDPCHVLGFGNSSAWPH